MLNNLLKTDNSLQHLRIKLVLFLAMMDVLVLLCNDSASASTTLPAAAKMVEMEFSGFAQEYIYCNVMMSVCGDIVELDCDGASAEAIALYDV